MTVIFFKLKFVKDDIDENLSLSKNFKVIPSQSYHSHALGSVRRMETCILYLFSYNVTDNVNQKEKYFLLKNTKI